MSRRKLRNNTAHGVVVVVVVVVVVGIRAGPYPIIVRIVGKGRRGLTSSFNSRLQTHPHWNTRLGHQGQVEDVTQ